MEAQFALAKQQSVVNDNKYNEEMLAAGKQASELEATIEKLSLKQAARGATSVKQILKEMFSIDTDQVSTDSAQHSTVYHSLHPHTGKQQAHGTRPLLPEQGQDHGVTPAASQPLWFRRREAPTCRQDRRR